MTTYVELTNHQYKFAASVIAKQYHSVAIPQEQVATTNQKQQRALQLQTMAMQKHHLQCLLCRRLAKAAQSNNVELIRQLRREWTEMFPEVLSPCQ